MSEQEDRLRELEKQTAVIQQRLDQNDATLSRIWNQFRTVEIKQDDHYEKLMTAITANKLAQATIQGGGRVMAAIGAFLVAVITIGLSFAKLIQSWLSG